MHRKKTEANVLPLAHGVEVWLLISCFGIEARLDHFARYSVWVKEAHGMQDRFWFLLQLFGRERGGNTVGILVVKIGLS